MINNEPNVRSYLNSGIYGPDFSVLHLMKARKRSAVILEMNQVEREDVEIELTFDQVSDLICQLGAIIEESVIPARRDIIGYDFDMVQKQRD